MIAAGCWLIWLVLLALRHPTKLAKAADAP
jgi:hypothetical protein